MAHGAHCAPHLSPLFLRHLLGQEPAPGDAPGLAARLAAVAEDPAPLELDFSVADSATSEVRASGLT